MARTPLQSVGAITVWMIVFVALWLVSTVLLVVLYTGQAELKSDSSRLRADADRLISRSERSSIELVRNLVDGGPTAVGLLEGARRETTLLATGNADDNVDTIRANRDRLFAEIKRDGLVTDADRLEGLSLLEALATLYEAYTTQSRILQEARESTDRLEDEVTELTRLNEAQKNDFDERARQLSDQLAAAEAGRAEYRAERDRAIERLQRQFEAARARSTAELTNQRQQTAKLERDLAELRKRFAAREEKFGELLMGPAAFATARQPDGTILTAIPGDDVVYIDLGRKDRLTLGLQFAVYSAETGIPADGRSKAQIEVAAISDSTAECKIVDRAESQIVLKGDLIANPIYDPSRAQTFLVIGEFDFDGNGTADRGGTAVIESMVTDWGGVLTTELTARTDFVVLGAAPRKPRPVSDPSAEQAERNTAAQREWDRYTETVASAKALSIPVMTQDLFLNFLGYQGRYASR